MILDSVPPPAPKGGVDDYFSGAKSKASKNDAGGGFGGKGGGKQQQPLKSKFASEIEVVVKALVGAASDCQLLDLKDCTRGTKGDIRFTEGCDRLNILVRELMSHTVHHHPQLIKHYASFERKELLLQKTDRLKYMLSNEALQLFPDFLQRKAVLQRLRYIDVGDTVAVKGRVACEVNTCEELLVAEMIFEGLLDDLSPPAIAAALSSLIFQEKKAEADVGKELPEALRDCCQAMKLLAINLGVIQKEAGLMIDPLDYEAATLKFGLVHVVYEWACGVPFKQICELTDVQEDSIVRTIVRLDECLREVRNGARIIGNATLYRKCEEASVMIKRDIVFASSLYVA